MAKIRGKDTLRLLPKCLGRSTSLLGVKSLPHFGSHFDSFRLALFSLALHLCSSYVFTKWCKIYTKNWLLDPKIMSNLDNFRQAVKSPKSSNSIGCICAKNTFLQVKHYIQRIYLTLLSTTVKIHQIHFWHHKLIFTTQIVCIFLAQTLHTSDKNIP